jgi:hypothetical protein
MIILKEYRISLLGKLYILFVSSCSHLHCSFFVYSLVSLSNIRFDLNYQSEEFKQVLFHGIERISSQATSQGISSIILG